MIVIARLEALAALAERHERLRAIQQQARDEANAGHPSPWRTVIHMRATLRIIDNAIGDLIRDEKLANVVAQHVAEIVAEATR